MKQEAQVAKRDNTGPLATNVFEADADKGTQNITQEDLALPFLKVLILKKRNRSLLFPKSVALSKILENNINQKHF